MGLDGHGLGRPLAGLAMGWDGHGLNLPWLYWP